MKNCWEESRTELQDRVMGAPVGWNQRAGVVGGTTLEGVLGKILPRLEGAGLGRGSPSGIVSNSLSLNMQTRAWSPLHSTDFEKKSGGSRLCRASNRK